MERAGSERIRFFFFANVAGEREILSRDAWVSFGRASKRAYCKRGSRDPRHTPTSIYRVYYTVGDVT